MLVVSDTHEDPCYFATVRLLATVEAHREIYIVDGHRGELARQYDDNIRRVGYAPTWLNVMRKSNRVAYFESRVPNKARRALREIGFSHKDDFVVGLALAAGAPIVTSDEDFLAKTIFDELSARLGLTILPACDALVGLAL
ncbi:MAG TPA: hypothetical protein VGR87_11515 [Candidatus Limnocylindria bacterium]|nr:hypothetical protein [Candidatus Limnocylindria bacterium]